MSSKDGHSRSGSYEKDSRQPMQKALVGLLKQVGDEAFRRSGLRDDQLLTTLSRINNLVYLALYLE